MGSYNVQVTLSVLFFLAAVEIGSSLTCYNCTQVKDGHCKDTFKKEHISKIDCLDSQVCIKHKQPAITIDSTDNHSQNLTTNIVRGCKPRDYCKQVINFADHCSSCETNLCNSSSALTPSCIVVALLYASKSLIF